MVSPLLALVGTALGTGLESQVVIADDRLSARGGKRGLFPGSAIDRAVA